MNSTWLITSELANQCDSLVWYILILILILIVIIMMVIMIMIMIMIIIITIIIINYSVKCSKALYNQGEKLKIIIEHNHSLKWYYDENRILSI